MSYGVHAYAVDLPALRKAVGSGDAVLAKRLTKAHARELARIDRTDFDDDLVSTADCLTRLVVEGAPDDDEDDEDAPAHKLGYALEVLCLALGERLPNRVFSAMHGDLFETLDAAAKALGLRWKPTALFHGSAPVELPFIEDFPVIGSVDARTTAAWVAELSAAVGGGGAAGAVALQFVGEGSRKFWRGRAEGKVLTVHFGRIGTAGQTKKKSFRSPAEAAAALEKVAAEKRAKGYREEERDPLEDAFSGRVTGTTLVLRHRGKETRKTFASRKAAQLALVELLAEANRGGDVSAKEPGKKKKDAAGKGVALSRDAEEGLRELLGWLEAAAKKKRGLVTFYY